MKHRIKLPFEDIFNEASLLPEIRRSIYFITLANIFGSFWGVVCNTGSATLTGFAGYLGAGDFVFGILTAIPLAAAFLQIPFSSIVSRTQKRKKYLLTYGLISRLIWIVVAFIPYFLPAVPAWLRLWTVISLVGISWSLGSFINVSWMPWMADLVPIEIRGRWLSGRDRFTAVASVTMGLLVSAILDRTSGYTGYTIALIMGGIFGALDMISFGFAKEVYKTPPLQLKMLPVFKKIIRDKEFFRFTVFWTAWNFTANIGGAYLARYALTEMSLSYIEFTLSSQVASALVTVTVISLWGKLLDRYGSKTVMWLSCVITAMTPLFYLLSVPGSIWPTLLHNCIGAAFWSGCNLAATSLQLSASPDTERPTYIAFFSCVTSVAGSFLGILTGGALLEGIGSSSLLSPLFPDRYKAVITISVLLRLCSVFIFVPKLQNYSNHTVVEVFNDFFNKLKVKIKRAE